jgi:hypothetical protein
MEEIPAHGEIQLSDVEGYSENRKRRDIDHYNQILAKKEYARRYVQPGVSKVLKVPGQMIEEELKPTQEDAGEVLDGSCCRNELLVFRNSVFKVKSHVCSEKSDRIAAFSVYLRQRF